MHGKQVRLLDCQVSLGQGRFLLLQNLHSRHPWRLQIFAPRQLLSYKDVINAENAEAFFCPHCPNTRQHGNQIPPSKPGASSAKTH